MPLEQVVLMKNQNMTNVSDIDHIYLSVRFQKYEN